MLTEEVEPLPVTARRERMLQMIAEREFVRVADLSEAFGISDVTVRADLHALDRSSAIRRVRGGAMARTRKARTEPSYEESLVTSPEEKQLIGVHAAAMVRPGMSILLDVGTTTTAIARALVARTDLDGISVITNGLTVAMALESAMPRISVVVTGGTLRRLQHSLVDPMASTVLERVRADLVFVGCNGVHVIHGVTNLNLPEADMKRRMIQSAERCVVVADGSKLGQVHLGRVASLPEVSSVVTGSSADNRVVADLRRAGTEVVQVH